MKEREVSEMLLGPYSSWQGSFLEKNKASFYDLLSSSEQFDKFNGNKNILSIMEAMPFSTEFIGLIREDNQKINKVRIHSTKCCVLFYFTKKVMIAAT